MSSDIKTMQMHPLVNSGWQARLTGEDPSGFRQSMAELQYQGQDPNWFRQELIDGMHTTDQPSAGLGDKCETLRLAKSEIAQ